MDAGAGGRGRREGARAGGRGGREARSVGSEGEGRWWLTERRSGRQAALPLGAGDSWLDKGVKQNK